MALALVLGMGAGFTACNKQEPAKAPEASTEAPAAPPPNPTKEKSPESAPAEKPKAETPAPEAPAKEAVTTPPPSASGPSDAELADRVNTFKALHPFQTGADLIRVQPFASALTHVLDGIGGNPLLLDRVQKALNLPVSSGPATIDLKLKNYAPAFANRLLTAVLSGQPDRLVDLVLSHPQDATFILSSK